MKVKQATKIFKRNSLSLRANIKVSFVALNQIRNSKNECDFKKIVSGQFWDCCVHKIAHTSQETLAICNFLKKKQPPAASVLPTLFATLWSHFALSSV